MFEHIHSCAIGRVLAKYNPPCRNDVTDILLVGTDGTPLVKVGLCHFHFILISAAAEAAQGSGPTYVGEMPRPNLN